MDSKIYDTYFKLEDSHWWFLGRKKILADIIAHIVPRRVESACDIGCGKGENLVLLSRVADSLSGIEMSPEAVALARTRFPHAAIETGSFPGISVPHNTDLVTMFDVLEHIEDDAGALNTIRGSLAPGGLLVCTVPAFPFLWSAHDDIVHHKRRYTKRTLRRALEKAGFVVERTTYFNAFFFVPTCVFRMVKRLVSHTPSSDLFPFPLLINSVFTLLFGAERFLLRILDLPFGVSVLAIARKPGMSA